MFLPIKDRTMKVKIKKLDERAIVPTYAHEGDACFDIHALDISSQQQEYMDVLHPVLCKTGLSFEVPEGHVMLVFSRSGHGFKEGIRLANCVGVIDSGYRGELMVKLTKDDRCVSLIRAGDRVAQALILPVEHVDFDVVDNLGESVRGERGLGSSNPKKEVTI
jgi:dUTP pyrophosphatase